MAVKPTTKTNQKSIPASKKAKTEVMSERAADRAERAALKVLERTERLKDLDKIGVHRQVSGFVTFLREQSVVGLAVGLVLGTQAKALVDQIITSFINPFVGLLLPGEGTLRDKTFWLSIGDKGASFGWGAFILVLINFVVVAAVIYFIVKGLRLDRLDKKKED